MIKKFLDILFPSNFTCDICGSEIYDDSSGCFCEKCKSKLKYITGNVCEKCGYPINNHTKICDFCVDNPKSFTKAISMFEYDGGIRSLVLKLKFENGKYLAKNFASVLYQAYLKLNVKCDVVTFVPMSIKSLQKRGYNQAKLLAHHFAEKANIPLVEDVVIKDKETFSQASLSFKDRQTNLNNCFKIMKKLPVLDKNVVLIDDIYTTGSTCNSVAKMLLKAGAKNVYVITIAHTIYKGEKKDS